MPFILIFIGLALISTGWKNSQASLWTLLKGDFTGAQNFTQWIVALFAIGAVGYIPGLKKVSDGFLILVLLVLFIKNKGVFQQFNQQVKSGTATPSALPQVNTAQQLNSLTNSSVPQNPINTLLNSQSSNFPLLNNTSAFPSVGAL